LTLTIDAFVPEEISPGPLKDAGNYSSVFPLLAVAVFVALQISRGVVFYPMQRSRGDINALPQALCEPGMEGKPLVIDYDGNQHELDDGEYDFDASDSEGGSDPVFCGIPTKTTSHEDIEANFQFKIMQSIPEQTIKSKSKMSSKNEKPRSSSEDHILRKDVAQTLSDLGLLNSASSDLEEAQKKKSLYRLDELLNGGLPGSSASNEKTKKKRTHRRTQSEPFCIEGGSPRMNDVGNGTFGFSTPMRGPLLKHRFFR
jgi:hypothetical protein